VVCHAIALVPGSFKMTARHDTGLQPTNDEGPAGDTAQGFKGVAQSVSHHAIADDLQRKAFTTWQAKFAMRGYTLAMTDTCMYAARWGFIYELADLAAVEDFAARAGVTQ
jgi:hypothetical protein